MKKKIIGLIFAVFVLAFQIQSAKAQDQELLTAPWNLSGNNGAAELYQNVSNDVLKDKDKIKLTYNLHGLCALSGDASAIVFDQNGWKYVSLSSYGQNCKDGEQTVEIPLSDFKDIGSGQQLDTKSPLTGSLHTRFWFGSNFNVNISSAVLTGLTTSSSVPEATPTPTNSSSQAPSLLSTSFKGEYWNLAASGKPSIPSGTADLTRDDKNINFIWNNGSPDPEIQNNRFSARWTKTENFKAGTYSFKATADDGVRLYIDDQIIIDQWKNQASTTYSINKPLTDGNHSIKMEYYENYGGAIAKLSYTQISGTVLSPAPTSTPTPTSAINPPSQNAPGTSPVTAPSQTSANWSIKSVDAMKATKDAVCGQKPQDWINKWLDKAVELGANYVAISTPYENPSCGNANAYTKTWINSIRAHGLKVWHRQMPLAFEGIYNVSKNNSSNFLNVITGYIKANPSNYQPGDIFTPIPEPQNGGISGITYCASGVCQYTGAASFNQWLRDAVRESKTAFQSIAKTGIEVGYFGFDGFVAWGANNPDWNGILENSTVSEMGNITIDHYPEAIGDTMENGLNELEAKYPGVPIIIGEWGTISAGDAVQQVKNSLGAAKRASVKGFNYWQFGPDGVNEALINSDFSNKPQFSTVQSFFK